MSVIGRLDEQVNEVLIEPLKKKKDQETNERRDEHSHRRETTQIEPAAAEKSEVERKSLPVWLL
jgi:hypothetical protein